MKRLLAAPHSAEPISHDRRDRAPDISRIEKRLLNVTRQAREKFRSGDAAGISGIRRDVLDIEPERLVAERLAQRAESHSAKQRTVNHHQIIGSASKQTP